MTFTLPKLQKEGFYKECFRTDQGRLLYADQRPQPGRFHHGFQRFFADPGPGLRQQSDHSHPAGSSFSGRQCSAVHPGPGTESG